MQFRHQSLLKSLRSTCPRAQHPRTGARWSVKRRNSVLASTLKLDPRERLSQIQENYWPDSVQLQLVLPLWAGG